MPDEEGVADTGVAERLRKCQCRIQVSTCRCCPFYSYRDPKDYNYYQNQHKEEYCWGAAVEEKSWTGRQMRESLPEGYKGKPLTAIVDWLFRMSDSLADKQQEVLANNVVGAHPRLQQCQVPTRGGLARGVQDKGGRCYHAVRKRCRLSC